MMLAAMFSGM